MSGLRPDLKDKAGVGVGLSDPGQESDLNNGGWFFWGQNVGRSGAFTPNGFPEFQRDEYPSYELPPVGAALPGSPDFFLADGLNLVGTMPARSMMSVDVSHTSPTIHTGMTPGISSELIAVRSVPDFVVVAPEKPLMPIHSGLSPYDSSAVLHHPVVTTAGHFPFDSEAESRIRRRGTPVAVASVETQTEIAVAPGQDLAVFNPGQGYLRCPSPLKVVCWIVLGSLVFVSQPFFGGYLGISGYEAIKILSLNYSLRYSAKAAQIAFNIFGGLTGLAFAFVIINFKKWVNGAKNDWKAMEERWVDLFEGTIARSFVKYFHILLYVLVLWPALSLAPALALKDNGLDSRKDWWVFFLSVVLFVGDYPAWAATHLDQIITAPARISDTIAARRKIRSAPQRMGELKRYVPNFFRLGLWVVTSLIHMFLQGARLGFMGASGVRLFFHFERTSWTFRGLQIGFGLLAAYQTLFTACAKAFDDGVYQKEGSIIQELAATYRNLMSCRWVRPPTLPGFLYSLTYLSIWGTLVAANADFVGQYFHHQERNTSADLSSSSSSSLNDAMTTNAEQATMIMVGAAFAAFTVAPQFASFITPRVYAGMEYLAQLAQEVKKKIGSCCPFFGQAVRQSASAPSPSGLTQGLISPVADLPSPV